MHKKLIALLLSGIFFLMFALQAQAQSRYQQLSTALADAVRRADDVQIVDLAARLRALGQDVGREINFAEAQALLRMQKVQAAQRRIDDYLARPGRFGKQAKMLKEEVARRLKYMDESWSFPRQPGITLTQGDGAALVIGTSKDYLASSNTVTRFFDSAGTEQWRTVFGDATGNFVTRAVPLEKGGFVSAIAMENGRNTSDGSPDHDSWLLFQDSSGRLINKTRFSTNVYIEKMIPDQQGVVVLIRDSRRKSNPYLIYGYDDHGNRRFWFELMLERDDFWMGGLDVDAEGYIHVYTLSRGKIYVYKPDGKQIRKIAGKERVKSSFGSEEWIWGLPDPTQLTKNSGPESTDIKNLRVSEDGQSYYVHFEKHYRGVKDVFHYIAAIDAKSGDVLWSHELDHSSSHYALGDGYYTVSHSSYSHAQDQDRLILALTNNNKVSIRAYDGKNGQILWERAEQFPDQSEVKIKKLTVEPHGYLLHLAGKSGSEEKLQLVHLVRREFAGLPDDPSVPLPTLSFWPFADNTPARVAARISKMEKDVELATLELEQCRASYISDNIVGKVREVQIEWGYLVVDLIAPRDRNDDLVILADGRLVHLLPGRQPIPTALSAIPENSNFSNIQPGMAVAASTGLPLSFCQAEQTRLAGQQSALRNLQSLQ